MPPEERVEVAIVGGGPAGAALAIRLGERGMDVALFERWPAPRWRAAGVYSSPLTRARLAQLGLSVGQLDALIRPIEAMDVVSTRGPACRLAYDPPAGGLDRVRSERALLDRAAAAGARIHEGAPVRDLTPGSKWTALAVSGAAGPERWAARLVVGATARAPWSLAPSTSTVPLAGYATLASRCTARTPMPPRTGSR